MKGMTLKSHKCSKRFKTRYVFVVVDVNVAADGANRAAAVNVMLHVVFVLLTHMLIKLIMLM